MISMISLEVWFIKLQIFDEQIFKKSLAEILNLYFLVQFFMSMTTAIDELILNEQFEYQKKKASQEA